MKADVTVQKQFGFLRGRMGEKITNRFPLILRILGAIGVVFVSWVVLVALSLWLPGGIKIPFIGEAPAKEQFSITGFSPDSQRLYLEFSDTSHHVRIGWLDLATKQVSLLVPQNTQDQLASPSSSTDGKQLAIVIKAAASNYEKSQIGVLDLDSKTYRVITKSDSYKQFPSFSTDGEKIIYAQAAYRRKSGMTRFSDWDIYEVDVATSVERRLTDFAFYEIDRPFYYPKDEKKFVFSGGAPTNSNSPHKHGKNTYEDYENIQRDRREYEKQYQENTIYMMSDSEKELRPLFLNGKSSHAPFVTRNGTIFFVSITNEMDGIKCCYFNYDAFEYESGATRRLTHLETYLSNLVVSPTGDLATYSSDKLRNRDAENWLMDIKSGARRKLSLGNSKSFRIVNVVNQ